MVNENRNTQEIVPKSGSRVPSPQRDDAGQENSAKLRRVHASSEEEEAAKQLKKMEEEFKAKQKAILREQEEENKKIKDLMLILTQNQSDLTKKQDDLLKK